MTVFIGFEPGSALISPFVGRLGEQVKQHTFSRSHAQEQHAKEANGLRGVLCFWVVKRENVRTQEPGLDKRYSHWGDVLSVQVVAPASTKVSVGWL